MNTLSISHLLEKYNKLINFIFIFIIAFACCIYFGRSVLTDPDIGWHIKAGEIIWQTKSIPHFDTLTFTSDQQWYNLSWLWDVCVYHIYNAYGIDGLTYTQAILFALIVTSLYIAATSLNIFSNDTLAIVTTIGGLLIWDLLYFRPQLISYIFALIVLILLIKQTTKSNFIIPLIVLLWANIHGSFIVSYTIMGAFVVDALFQKDYTRLKSLLIILTASIVVIILNPIGYKIIVAVSRTTNSAIMTYISEWLPFTFGREYSFTLVVLIMLGLGGFNNSSIPLAYRILAFSWLVASLNSKRSFGYFGIVAFPYLGYLFEAVIINSPSKFNLSPKTKIGMILGLVIITILHPLYKFKNNDYHRVPVDAIYFLNLRCHNARIFNDYNFGGFLALWLKNDIKYFIDGRAGTAFSEIFIKDYLKGTLDDGDIRKLITKNPVDAALISNDLKNKSTYALFFADWDLAYSDDYATIYFSKNINRCSKLGDWQ